MAQISTNVSKETLSKIIDSLKSSKISFYNLTEKDSHKCSYFDFEEDVYFIHSYNGEIDVINKVKKQILNNKEDFKKDSTDTFNNLIIYSDGGCVPNPGESGSGIAVFYNDEIISAFYGLYERESTNNIAELKALHNALIISKKYIENGTSSITIKTDSQYSMNCLTLWIDGWIKNNWRNAKKEPIKNKELIKESYQIYLTIKDKVKIDYVKGHAGILGNEICDYLATFSIENKEKDLKKFKELDKLKDLV